MRRFLITCALAIVLAGCDNQSPTSPSASPTPTPTPTPPPSCTYTVSDGPATAIPAGGGEFTITITTASSCAWIATSAADFITPDGAATGSGSGSVRFVVAANPGPSREGTVTVAGRTMTVAQQGVGAPPCLFTVSPTQTIMPAAASSRSITITMTSGVNCSWTAESLTPWLSITGPAAGVGSGSIIIAVEQNTGPPRTGTLKVAGSGVMVVQSSAPAGGAPVAYLAFQSDPGDYIGVGSFGSYDLLAHQFTATLDASRAELQFRMFLSQWSLTMEAPAGQQLTVGTYEFAERWPFQSPSRPGLDFSGMGRGCNRVTGRFRVDEAVYGPSNSVDRFHAVFEQHCDGWSAALRGQIWIDANGVQAPPASPLPTPGSPTTSFSYVSDAGDPVGGGQSHSFSLANAKFSAWGHPSRPAVNIVVMDPPAASFAWTLSLEGPSGMRLVPGTYTNATRYPFQAPGAPGMDVVGPTGCNTLTGSFVVLEATYGPQGEVLRFHATFEQHCNGAIPALRGEIRIVADPWR